MHERTSELFLSLTILGKEIANIVVQDFDEQ
jgi:hypothetical protein